MIPKQKIEKGQYWDDSLTLMSGCSRESEGCENCWAAAMASRFPWGEKYARNKKWTGIVEPNWKALKKLEKRAVSTRKLKPKVWQIWNDLFHEKLSDEILDNVMRWCYHCQRMHGDIFLILTKRPQNIFKPGWYSFDRAAETNHIYVGVSVESQKYIHRVDELIQNWPGKKFVSIEPCLGAVYLSSDQLAALDQVIIGCESGANRREPPDMDLYDMVFQCRKAGVPVFLKQWIKNGKFVKMPEYFGRHWDQLTWNIEKGQYES